MKNIHFLVLFLVFAFIGCDTADREISYTVTFDLDGGNINGNTNSVNIQVNTGGTIKDLPVPDSMPSVYFSGWFTQKNGYGDVFTAATTVNSNVTVYAYWMFITIPPSPYWGIWENNEFQCQMIITGMFDDDYGSWGGYVEYQIYDGVNWSNMAFGELSIINHTNVIFVVTYKWIPETSTYSNNQIDLDTLLEYFGGSLTLNGTINGTADGSIMGNVINFYDFHVFTQKTGS